MINGKYENAYWRIIESEFEDLKNVLSQDLCGDLPF